MYGHALSVVMDKHDFLERGNLLVVVELLALIVGCGRRAENLDEHRRIEHRDSEAIFDRDVERSTHDRDIWIGQYVRRTNSHSQVGAVDTTLSSAEGHVEQRPHVHRKRGVIWMSAGHRVDDAVDELQLDHTHLGEGDVLDVRITTSAENRHEIVAVDVRVDRDATKAATAASAA